MITTSIIKPAAACILASVISFSNAADTALLPVAGFQNSSAPVQLNLIARYSAGQTDYDGGVMEIIAYSPANGFAYAINGKKGEIAILNISSLTSQSLVELKGTNFDVEDAVEDMDGDFDYGDMSSIAMSPDGTTLAVALQADDHDDQGRVAIFSCLADGSLQLKKVIPVGIQPDMVCFADAATVLTADEAEPREGYEKAEDDPKCSISIVNIATGSSKILNFDAFDAPAARAALVKSGVLLKKGAMPSRDLEPEYITVNGGKAYVTLQEANAIAVVNIAAQQIDGVYPLGFIDYSKTKIDLNSKDKGCKLMNHPGVMGMRMPDTIASFKQGGSTYLLVANEGDHRKYGTKNTDNYYTNKDKVKLGKGGSSAAGHITPTTFGSDSSAKINMLKGGSVEGVQEGKDYIFGGRSFSIYRASSNGVSLVFDSGSDFERISAQCIPQYYNTSNDTLKIDDRSGKKGPEPESLTIGSMGNKTYAFVGLERTGGIMVYDITSPSNATFINYINSRNFNEIIRETYDEEDLLTVTGGDVAPEGMVFIPANQNKSGSAILLVANEVSGTVSVISVKQK